MMTSASQVSIEWLFRNAIEENVLAGGHAKRVAIHNKPEADDNKRNSQLVALNIASYTFRIVALFDFSTDPLTLAHFSRQAANTGCEHSNHTLSDSFTELTNMICGAVNRQLGKAFRHAGMSTPMLLDSTCAHYISLLNPTHVLRLEVRLDDSVRFDVMVCTCLSRNTRLDFSVAQSKHEEAESGELQLF